MESGRWTAGRRAILSGVERVDAIRRANARDVMPIDVSAKRAARAVAVLAPIIRTSTSKQHPFSFCGFAPIALQTIKQ